MFKSRTMDYLAEETSFEKSRLLTAVSFKVFKAGVKIFPEAVLTSQLRIYLL